MPSIEQLERLLEADPQDAFVLYGLAQEHAKAGRVDRAVEYYDRCLSADPGYLYAYFHKARALVEAGREADAAAVLREGLVKARGAGDGKAAGEIGSFLDEITP